MQLKARLLLVLHALVALLQLVLKLRNLALQIAYTSSPFLNRRVQLRDVPLQTVDLLLPLIYNGF